MKLVSVCFEFLFITEEGNIDFFVQGPQGVAGAMGFNGPKGEDVSSVSLLAGLDLNAKYPLLPKYWLTS